MWPRKLLPKCGPLTSARQRGRSPLRRPLGLEPLEDRTLPSTFHVANGDVAGLIAAIHTADSNQQDNTIILARDGSYVLSAADNSVHGPTGLPVIDACGYRLTIKGRGATLSRSTAAGTPAFRLLDVAAGAALELRDMTLANGLETGATAQGGSIYSHGS